MVVDTQLFYLLHSLVGVSPILDTLIIFGAAYFPYLLILIVVGLVARSPYPLWEKVEILFVTAFSSLVARYGVTTLIRLYLHRPRPFITLPIHPLVTETSWSFPSGHATFFFGMAMAVYLYNKQWGKWLFLAATLISLCRVIAGVHYPSDIVAGALIGCLVAYIVDVCVRRFIRTRSNQTY